MSKKSKSKDIQPIIVIKKVKKVAAGHHGGAWKVAYADFVTAMMAFFLLLWLLNVVTDESLKQVAAYFDPAHPRLAESMSGAGGLMGGRSMSKDGAMIADRVTIDGPRSSGAAIQESNFGEEGQKTETTPQIEFDDIEIDELEELLRSEEAERFAEAKEVMEKALEENEELRELSKNLMIDMTPEGLRIQIVDQEGRPMFPIGSADMFDYTKELMAVVADVIKEMPNDVSIRGHTDSYKYSSGAAYTNWELSADRANSSRRVLMNNGLKMTRLSDVMGKGDQEHLFAEDPLDPRNRRISIILLHETVQHAFDRGAFEKMKTPTTPNVIDGEQNVTPYNAFDDFKLPEDGNIDWDNLPREDERPVGTFQKTPGTVYFP